MRSSNVEVNYINPTTPLNKDDVLPYLKSSLTDFKGQLKLFNCFKDISNYHIARRNKKIILIANIAGMKRASTLQVINTLNGFRKRRDNIHTIVISDYFDSKPSIGQNQKASSDCIIYKHVKSNLASRINVMLENDNSDEESFHPKTDKTDSERNNLTPLPTSQNFLSRKSSERIFAGININIPEQIEDFSYEKLSEQLFIKSIELVRQKAPKLTASQRKLSKALGITRWKLNTKLKDLDTG